MFTAVTYQDWESTPEAERPELIEKIIRQYQASDDFRTGLEASRYDAGDNSEIARKVILRPVAVTVPNEDVPGAYKKVTETREIVGTRIRNSFLHRFVSQEAQHLLGNGVTLSDEATKKRLGPGFDTALARMGRKALLHGVCWGFWNVDHIEVLEAVKDAMSGFVALLDERTGTPSVGVQFWRLDETRPLYARLFEPEGVTLYRKGKDDTHLEAIEPRRGYIKTTISDGQGVVSEQYANYGPLPVIPLYGNEDRVSEFTLSIKTKIDTYDRIFSDFGDNLDRANDIYWVFNNFAGSTSQIAETMDQIYKLRAVLNQSDGTGTGSTAEPHTIEVPYAARHTALELLRKALYEDYMGLDTSAFGGSSMTNVGIQAATTNLNLKCDGLEWGAMSFVQGVLMLLGIQTEEIAFKRRDIVNKSEIVQDIYTMRADLDRRTALKKNPYIDQEEIDGILEAIEAEEAAGAADMRRLNEKMAEAMRDEAENGNDSGV